MKKRVALYPGSFDPPTRGHLCMIEEGAELFDELIVADGINPQKNGHYMFSSAERTEMLRKLTEGMPNVRVHDMGTDYQYRTAQELGAGYLFYGERSTSDFAEQLAMIDYHTRQCPELKTVKMVPPLEFRHVASSVAKSHIGYKNWWWELKAEDCLPEVIYDRVLLHVMLEKWSEAFGFPDIGKVLLKGHMAPERHYHNLEHLLHCDQEFEEVKHLFVNPLAAWLAFTVHDSATRVNPHFYLYDGWSFSQTQISVKTLEEYSADHAAKIAEHIGWDRQAIEYIHALVSATAHKEPGTNADEQLAQDIDLAIFGQEEDIFRKYEADIRLEYSDFSAAVYRKGREKALMKFLKRDPIYQTDHFRQKYESNARKNLQWSIDNLPSVS